VGLLRPNELGLFDLHGNAVELCHNRLEALMDIKDLQKDDIVDNIRSSRPVRGGAYFMDALRVRSALRTAVGPANNDFHFGFRPARTFR
jgi:formylglycine-generating enzyme required for sulfatase activity